MNDSVRSVSRISVTSSCSATSPSTSSALNLGVFLADFRAEMKGEEFADYRARAPCGVADYRAGANAGDAGLLPEKPQPFPTHSPRADGSARG